MTTQETGAPRSTPARRASAFLHRHPALRAAGLVSAPLLWLGLIYLVALAALLITAFWTVDFANVVTREWNLDNFRKILAVGSFSDQTVYREVIFRTVWVAAAVTAIDAVLALPVAFFMAKIA